MKKPFKKVAIVGVGLIGGSIGLALKKRRMADEVTGVFRRPSSLNKALGRLAVDRGTLDLEKGVSDADLVIIAADVGQISRLAKECAGHMKKGSVLTDVGSVKSVIVSEIERSLPPGVLFVGGHPMAGSEKDGVESAREGLFERAVVILTKTGRTDRHSLEALGRFWRGLGARTLVMDPRDHDRRISMISHLPQMTAVALCLAQDKASVKCAAGGFRDSTRIASSHPEMWLEILKANQKQIIASLDAFSRKLTRARGHLARRDYAALLSMMRRAKKVRDGIK